MSAALPPEVKVFEKDVGTWDAEIEVRSAPGAQPERSRGLMTQRIVAGRWLISDFKNLDSGFEGHGIHGWDSLAHRYTGVWVDTMRSALVVMNGEWDAEKRVMTYRAEMQLPNRLVRWREVTESKDADHQVFRSLMEVPG